MADDLYPRIAIPEPVLAAGERIARAGGEIYIVGGWVRDSIRGVACNDIDLATSLGAPQVKEAVAGLGTVYDIGEKFGTIGVVLDEYKLEITTYRRDEYTAGSRHPAVSPVSGILEDLARRDFTINSLAVSVEPEPGRLIDPLDGLTDISRGVIRTCGKPAPRMSEDPLRMMRAVRFASQLGYSIVPALHAALRENSPLLDSISRERRRDELERILTSEYAGAGVRMLIETGLMAFVSPEVSAMRGVEQPPAYHRADVLEHTILTIGYLEPDPLLRRAALFHDVGKPPAKVTEPKTMFPEHDKLGESLTREAMRRLRYSNDDVQKTTFLVRRHMRPIQFRSDWSNSAVRRLVRDCVLSKEGEVLVPLESVVELSRADIRAGSLETVGPNLALVDELGERIKDLQAVGKVETAHSPLDGADLMEIFGRPPGPWLKQVKEHLLHLVLEEELEQGDRDGAAGRAREFLESDGE